MAIVWMDGFDHYSSIHSPEVAGVQAMNKGFKISKSRIIEGLEAEVAALGEQIDQHYQSDDMRRERQQIRTQALHLALAHRLGDNVTNTEILANAASYEQFIGGYDSPAQPPREPGLYGVLQDIGAEGFAAQSVEQAGDGQGAQVLREGEL